MTDPALLRILCCPETHQPLHPADAAIVEPLNQKIPAGQVLDRSGKVVIGKIEAGYVREDGQCLYPIRQGLPILLVDESIRLVGW